MAGTRLAYPENVGTQDYVKVEFGDYIAPIKGGAKVGGATSTFYNTTVAFTAKDSLYLNMPSDLGSNFGGQWGGKDITALAGFAVEKVAAPVTNLVTGKPGDAMTSLTSVFTGDTFVKGAGALGEDVLKALGEKFTSLPGLGANLNTNDILALSSGTIINPNTELLYGGTGLRSHGYTFKMIPQSKKEAGDIIKIVDRFKQACAPKKSSQSVGGVKVTNFIGLPDIVRIGFYNNNGENIYLPRYKESALTSVSVDYITDGQYVGLRDGEPIGVSLTIALTELKLIFSDDIGPGATQYR